MEHGCPVEDYLLNVALARGDLPSVALFVRHGLPQTRPFHHGANGPSMGSDHLRCLRHLIDSGCPIHPGTLISAASQGNVDTVRLLHEGGVPLWERAWTWEVETGPHSLCANILLGLQQIMYAEQHKLIVVPQVAAAGVQMRKVLRYGACMGAPVTPGIEEMLRADRAGTRAVLLSFHVAAGLSQGKGVESGKVLPPHNARSKQAGSVQMSRRQDAARPCKLNTKRGRWKQRDAWAVMARMPPDLIDKILVLADLEIPESARRTVPTQCCVRVQLRGPDELCRKGVKEYAVPSRSTK